MPKLIVSSTDFDLDSQQTVDTPALYTARVGTDPASWKTMRINVTAGNQKSRTRARASIAVPVFDVTGVFIGQALGVLTLDIPPGAAISSRTVLGASMASLADIMLPTIENLKPNPITP